MDCTRIFTGMQIYKKILIINLLPCYFQKSGINCAKRNNVFAGMLIFGIFNRF